MNQDKQLYESDRVWNQEMQLGQKNLLQALADFMPEDVSTILDVGCGDGKITQQLIALTGKRIVGLDSSAEALSRCTFEVVSGDATALDFEDASFDAVMTTDMLEHLPDDIEKMAWQELFRVAAKNVLVAVPFREELLDAMACCEQCGTKYHVNWHMRTYDYSQLVSRAPQGWRAASIVLTGEPWPPYHPIETRFRRELFNEWSGWVDAICPHCGASGNQPEQPGVLPSRTAAALGELIYADLHERGITRTHSEILVLYCRDDCEETMLGKNLARANEVRQEAGVAHVFQDKLEINLQSYPRAGRTIAAADGGIIVQLPLYTDVDSLEIIWRNNKSSPLSISVEDGLGVLFCGAVTPQAGSASNISFARTAVPGYYGLLVRFEMTDAIGSLELASGLTGLALSPVDGSSPGYYRTQFGTCPAYIQVTQSLWIDVDRLDLGANSDNRLDWQKLFAEIEQISKAERDALLVERNIPHGERDPLLIEREALRGERDALLIERDALRGERDALLIERDALRGERDALLIERDALRGERDTLLIERDILRGERDTLLIEGDTLRGERDGLLVERDALHAERDMFFARAEVRLSTAFRNKFRLSKRTEK